MLGVSRQVAIHVASAPSLESLVVKVEGARFKNPGRLQKFAELLLTDRFP